MAETIIWDNSNGIWKPGTAGVTQLSALNDVNLYIQIPQPMVKQLFGIMQTQYGNLVLQVQIK